MVDVPLVNVGVALVCHQLIDVHAIDLKLRHDPAVAIGGLALDHHLFAKDQITKEVTGALALIGSLSL